MRAEERSVLRRLRKDESGYILFMALFVFMIVMILGVALIVVGTSEANLSKRYTMMEQAYSNADAGVDRGIMAVAQDVASLHGGKLSGDTAAGAQWTSGNEDFGDNKNNYNVTVYQDDNNPGVAYFKKIISTGTFTFNEKVVKRTIETRCYVPVLGKDYDASFDYCIFNGFNLENGNGTWGEYYTAYTGKFILDGGSAYQGHKPKGAIYTRGNLDLKIQFGINSDLKFYGPESDVEGAAIVATGDVKIYNSGASNYEIHGDVIGGLDGSGNASVQTVGGMGTGEIVSIDNGKLMAGTDAMVKTDVTVTINNNLQIEGIKAGRNVDISGSYSISKAMQINGDIASGGKTTIKSQWATGGVQVDGKIYAGQYTDGLGVELETTAGSINVGNGIESRGEVKLRASAATFTTGAITAGNDTASSTGGTGVAVTLDWAGSCTTGNIDSAGEATFESKKVSTITTGHIYAGSQGGIGVQWTGDIFSTINAGNVQAVGNVQCTNTDGTDMTTGSIWSGGSVALNSSATWFTDMANCSITTGGISAVGSIRVDCADAITISGDVLAQNGSIRVYLDSSSIFPDDNQLQMAANGNVKAGDYITVTNANNTADNRCVTGHMSSVGNLNFSSRDSHNTTGLYSGVRSNFKAGNASHMSSTVTYFAGSDAWGGDSYIGTVRGTGAVDITHTDGTFGGDLLTEALTSRTSIAAHPDGDSVAWSNPDIHTGGATAPAWGDWSQDWDVSGSRTTADGGDPNVSAPSVGVPPQPAKPTAPRVGHNLTSPVASDIDLLKGANLQEPARVLEPSWGHFRDKAVKDDAVSTNPPHMVYDNGPIPGGTEMAGATAGDGEIWLDWEGGTGAGHYGTNETVYNDSVDTSIVIKKLIFPAGDSNYTGTIVSKGSVYLEAANDDWLVPSYEELNIAAGEDISRRTSGLLNLGEDDNCRFHFYAYRDIKLQNNLGFDLGGNKNLYGSFTAGNRFGWWSMSHGTDVVFHWSRWALDPTGWAPPFKVLSWREV